MWADTLQRAEQIHFLRLCYWGGLSTIAGTALLVLALATRRGSPIIGRFATVCALLGATELVIGGVAYHKVPLRDVASATRLDRMSWLLVGLYLGLAGVGITLMASSYANPRADTGANNRALSMVGAGAATLLHGLALATLQLLLTAIISR